MTAVLAYRASALYREPRARGSGTWGKAGRHFVLNDAAWVLAAGTARDCRRSENRRGLPGRTKYRFPAWDKVGPKEAQVSEGGRGFAGLESPAVRVILWDDAHRRGVSGKALRHAEKHGTAEEPNLREILHCVTAVPRERDAGRQAATSFRMTPLGCWPRGRHVIAGDRKTD